MKIDHYNKNKSYSFFFEKGYLLNKQSSKTKKKKGKMVNIV